METFPKQSVHGNAHTTTVEGRKYDVFMLIDLAREIEVVDVEVESLFRDEMRECKCWSDKKGGKVSPKEIIDCFKEHDSWEAVKAEHPEWIEHINKIKNADLSYPILIYKNDVVDGMHRLVRAFIDEIPSIKAKEFEVMPEEAIYAL